MPSGNPGDGHDESVIFVWLFDHKVCSNLNSFTPFFALVVSVGAGKNVAVQDCQFFYIQRFFKVVFEKRKLN
jgi:hypothetical protein